MSPTFGLPAINFFIADVGGGMGPFLPTWLAQVEHWSPSQISFILSAALVAGMVLNTPAGIVVDRLGRPRLMLFVTCIAILAGTLSMLVVRDFWLVLLTQILVAAGGALSIPALTALTLSVTGKNGFPQQQGINQAATHGGNVAAAVLIWAATFVIGPAASIVVLATMAVGMLVTLCLFQKGSIDRSRMFGRKEKKRKQTLWAMLRSRRLLTLSLVLGLFNLGNGAMLPLIGQRLTAAGAVRDPTQWVAVYVIVAQAVMIPAAWLAGRAANRHGRRRVVVIACAALTLRGVMTMLSANPFWLALAETLDGVGAGLVSVAGPAAVADLTYGGGNTQTAMGIIATVQALAAVLSFTIGAFLTEHLGWPAAFGALTLFPAMALATILTIQLTDEFPAEPEEPEGGSKAAAAMSARV